MSSFRRRQSSPCTAGVLLMEIRIRPANRRLDGQNRATKHNSARCCYPAQTVQFCRAVSPGSRVGGRACSCNPNGSLPKYSKRQKKFGIRGPAGNQLLDQQPGHNRFARTWIIGQQESQRRTRKHGLVVGGNLVRQRLHDARVHRQDRIEQVREMDTLSFGYQSEERSVTVKAPRAASLDDL